MTRYHLCQDGHGLRHMMYTGLREMVVFQLSEMKSGWRKTLIFSPIQLECIERARLLEVHTDRTRGNRKTLQQHLLDFTKTFSQRVDKRCNRLSRKAVESPSLEIQNLSKP